MVYRPSPEYPWNWNRLRHYIFERDNYICQICGRYTSHPVCDHIIPISISHNNKPENLRTLCPECHAKRHKKYIERMK